MLITSISHIIAICVKCQKYPESLQDFNTHQNYISQFNNKLCCCCYYCVHNRTAYDMMRMVENSISIPVERRTYLSAPFLRQQEILSCLLLPLLCVHSEDENPKFSLYILRILNRETIVFSLIIQTHTEREPVNSSVHRTAASSYLLPCIYLVDDGQWILARHNKGEALNFIYLFYF